jgi:hypothetical protein
VPDFDLIKYAEQHRYRVRNLHDGRPLHPLRVPVTGRGRSAGYVGDEDRLDAIIGRHGYVIDEGNGRIGWCLLTKAGWTKSMKLRRLEALGATVTQEGDTEAAGYASVDLIGPILEVLRPYRRARRPPVEQAVGTILHAGTAAGISAPPFPKNAAPTAPVRDAATRRPGSPPGMDPKGNQHSARRRHDASRTGRRTDVRPTDETRTTKTTHGRRRTGAGDSKKCFATGNW